MTYKAKQNWKDLIEPCKHKGMNRRDFMGRGLATGFMSVALSDALISSLVNKAMAADLSSCPVPVQKVGAIAQIFAEGGPTMGARFFSKAQADLMNPTMAANYGISGAANLMALGQNLYIDRTSAFGATLLQGPPGYTGGAAAWQANVLSKIAGGGHLGPFVADDGAGVNTGLVARISPFKASSMGKDLAVNVSASLAPWANGLPVAGVGSATAANFSRTFSLTPAAAGLTTTAAMNAASNAANALQSALNSVLATGSRKGADALAKAANCAFTGNGKLADPNYGTTLFTATAITDLTGKLTVANLSAQEQALLAAYYQSAKGVAGGVSIQFNGRDYHDTDPATNVGPKDIEEARAVVMFLAACEAANAPGALIYTSNGQAIASGIQPFTANINGANVNMNAPIAQGDAGGSYNGGLMIFYSPAGAPTTTRWTGTINASGNARVDGNVGSTAETMAGLYLSALKFINNGAIPPAALSAMNAVGLAKNTNNILVI